MELFTCGLLIFDLSEQTGPKIIFKSGLALDSVHASFIMDGKFV
jgi:hypothetical protein